MNMKRHNSDKTWTHGLFIVITHSASVLNETWVYYVSLQKEFSEWQSDRLEMDLFREIHIPQIECGPSQKTEWPWEKHTPQTECGPSECETLKYGLVIFYGLGYFIR